MGEDKNNIVNKIPEEIKLYNTVYLQYKKYGEEAKEKFNKTLEKYTNLDELVTDGFDASLDIIKNYIDDAIDILKDMDINDITSEDFTQNYYQKYCTSVDIFNNLEYKYKKIKKIVSEEKSNKEKKELFEDKQTRTDIIDCVEASVVNIHEAILDCLQDKTNTSVYRITYDDKKEAQELLLRLKAQEKILNNKTKLDILGKILGSNPYIEETYFYLIDINHGDKDNQIEQYANYFGIDLGKKKVELINCDIEKYIQSDLKNINLNDKKAKIEQYYKNYFSTKYTEKNSYANKSYLDNLYKIYNKALQEDKKSDSLKELIKQCNEIYKQYNDERFLKIEKDAEGNILKSVTALNLKKQENKSQEINAKKDELCQAQGAKSEQEVKLEQEVKSKQELEIDEVEINKEEKTKQQDTNKEKTQPSASEESALTRISDMDDIPEGKNTSGYIFKIIAIILMLLSGAKLLDTLIKILQDKLLIAKDLTIGFAVVIITLALSLICNKIATKKIYPNGKEVSDKNMIIRLAVGILCTLAGIIINVGYYKAFLYTIAIMIFIYIIRDSFLKRRNINKKSEGLN